MPSPTQQARTLIAQSSSNVEALIRLFEADDLPGRTAAERLRWLLRATASGLPGMQMGLFPADDSGFKPELADGRFYASPKYWARLLKPEERHTSQVGHFLIAVGLRYNPWPESVALRLIVGHEKLGDRLIFGFVRQYVRARHADRQLFREAVAHDQAGDIQRRDEALFRIFGEPDEAKRDPDRIGNSVPDLRLSVKGWRFGEAIRAGQLRTRAEAANWLRREIYDPTRTRAALQAKTEDRAEHPGGASR
jgi:hypothetical protein